MPTITCPSCGEDDDLAGKRRPDDVLEVTCLACGTVWGRGGARRCKLCGSDELQYAPRALWEKGRGEQRTPAGRIDAYYCHSCGGHDVTSSNPRPGPPDHIPARRVE